MEKKLSLKKVIIIGLFISIPFFYFSRHIWHGVYLKMKGEKTIEEVMKEIEPRVKNNVLKMFSQNKLTYPPEKITLISYKSDKVVELWVMKDGKNHYVKSYIVHKDSGKEGPKLREGDKQVPEGIYGIEYLNPNSKFHLSLKISYPNEFDKRKADIEQRTKPGTDIFIHGKDWSIGCLAMGDEQIEEIFYMVSETGLENVKVIIAPNREVKSTRNDVPLWTGELYSIIQKELKVYK